MNIEFQEKAEHYLLGKMSSSEAAEFEQLLNKNQELQEEFLIISDIHKHFSGDSSPIEIPKCEYVENLRTVLKSEDAKSLKRDIAKAGSVYKKESNSRRFFLKIAASLAFVLLASAGLYFFNGTDQEHLYASFYNPSDLPSIISRGSDETILKKAIVAFQNNDYQKALVLLESSESAKNSDEIAVLLHHGVILSETGNLNDAIDKFNKVIDSDSIDKSKGLWFKALAYIKVKDYKNAQSILEEISENPDFFNHAKAKELLGKIS